jgi:dipeptidyl aminopeptidase/acylaminoacyl peptidase
VYDPKTQEFRPYLNGASIGFLDYSPDGQWITYVAYPDGTLWRSRADGSSRQQLTTPDTGVILSPKWSPDGRFILFNAWQVDSRKEDYKQIYVIPAEGGSPLLLVSGKFEPADPTWSPWEIDRVRRRGWRWRCHRGAHPGYRHQGIENCSWLESNVQSPLVS